MTLFFNTSFNKIIFESYSYSKFLISVLHFSQQAQARLAGENVTRLLGTSEYIHQNFVVLNIASGSEANITKEYPEYVGHFLLEFLIKR